MRYGHICRNSLGSARAQMDENPSEVVCTNCGQVTGLKIIDNGFGDDFGGVSDYQCVTKCCESSGWEKGCSACGKVKPLVKQSEIVRGRSYNYWYCEKCFAELEMEKAETEEQVKEVIKKWGSVLYGKEAK